MPVCWVILRGHQIYTVIQAVHSLLYIVAKCHFFSVVTWKDIIQYLQKCEGCTHIYCIYICVCVCVYVCIYIYIYIYISISKSAYWAWFENDLTSMLCFIQKKTDCLLTFTNHFISRFKLDFCCDLRLGALYKSMKSLLKASCSAKQFD